MGFGKFIQSKKGILMNNPSLKIHPQHKFVEIMDHPWVWICSCFLPSATSGSGSDSSGNGSGMFNTAVAAAAGTEGGKEEGTNPEGVLFWPTSSIKGQVFSPFKPPTTGSEGVWHGAYQAYVLIKNPLPICWLFNLSSE